MKLIPLVAAALLAFSGAAMARQCPADMAKIDAALAKSPTLSAAEMAEVKKLRAEGEALHKAGKHPDSEATLAKAKKILKVS